MTHDWAQVTDKGFLSRHSLWHARSMGRFVRKHPETLDAAVTSKDDQYARKAAGWSDAEYADARAYLDHRAELIATLGTPLRTGDEVLDLACGDGGLGEHLLARGLRYTGIDAEPAMIDAARRRLGDRATVGVGDLNAFVPGTPVAATTVFRAIYYAHDRAAFFARVARFTERKLVFDLNPRQYRVAEVVAELGRRASAASCSARSSSRRRSASPASRSRSRRRPSAQARSHGSRSAPGSRTWSPPAAARQPFFI